MESTSCPMCEVDSGKLLLEGHDLLHDGEHVFTLNTCARCGHIYQNPRPSIEEIGRYYPPTYMPFLKAIEDEPSWFKRLDRHYGRSRRCQAVHKAAGKVGRLLDVGCATGIFLDGMRTLGWDVAGVEPTTSAAAYARDRFGLDVFEGRLEDAPFADHSFDVITLWDVLEHVHEPKQVLDKIHQLLRPGGLLVMSLPNPDSIEARFLDRYWAGWDLPRHLNLFRPTQLRQHLAQMGFQTQKIRSFTAGYSVLIMSLEHKLNAEGRDGKKLGRLLGAWPLRLLAKFYYNGPASYFNLSSIMVVFAIRETNSN